MDIKRITAQLSHICDRYKYVLLVFAIGIFLLSFPGGTKAPDQAETVISLPDAGDESLENRLEEILSHVEGAGTVKVLLSEDAGAKTQYAVNRNDSVTGESSSIREEPVIITDAARSQRGLVERVIPAEYRGAVVICQGAENPTVRLEIVQAVANASGLGFDKISVLKMK